MRTLLFLPGALALAACAAETSSPSVADHFEVVQAATSGTPGRPLDSLVVLRLVDDRGEPVVGASIAWSVVSGDGALTGAGDTTGGDGLVAVGWTLGPLPGTQRLRIASTGVPALELEVETNALHAVAVAVSEAAACAIDSLGDAWCWGGHPYHQPYANAYGPTPVRVDSGHAFRQIVGGTDHFCALTETGAAWCWGIGYRGELGTGSATPITLVPVPVAGGHAFTTLTATTWATCGIDQAGQAWCWGLPGDGSLGTGGASPLSPAPVLQGSTTFASISLGYEHACALEPDGQAWCWGHQDVGQLGDSSGTGSFVPVRVAGTTRFREISAGNHFTCAVALDGTLWCWGGPPFAPYRERRTPAPMGASGIRGLSGDDEFIVGVQASRPLSAGSNWYIGVPDGLGGGDFTAMRGDLYGIRQIVLRWANICMVRTDGMVFCAGEVPGYGPSATPVAIPAP